MKKWIAVFLGGPVAAPLALLIWQPDALKLWAARKALDRITRAQPYEIRVEAVRGNFFRTAAFQGVRVVLKSRALELAGAQSLSLRLEWPPLLNREAHLDRLTLVRPYVNAVMDAQGRWVLPAAGPPSQERPSPWKVYMDLLAIEEGEIVLTNFSLQPAGRARLTGIRLLARVTPGGAEVLDFQASLGGGRLDAKGWMRFTPPFPARLTARTSDFPFERALAAVMKPPAGLRLSHSGQWRVARSAGGLFFETAGVLDGAPLSASAFLPAQPKVYSARVELRDLPLEQVWNNAAVSPGSKVSCALRLSGALAFPAALNARGRIAWEQALPSGGSSRKAQAELALARGAGPIALALESAGLTANAGGRLDVPRRRLDLKYDLDFSSLSALAPLAPALEGLEGRARVSGEASGPFRHPALRAKARAEDVLWQNKKLAAADLDFTRAPGVKNAFSVRLRVDHFQSDAGQTGPWDLPRGSLALDGDGRRWNALLEAGFANGSTARYQGRVRKSAEAWRLEWDKAGWFVSLPNRDGWNSPDPGSLEVGPGRLRVENFVLSHGPQIFRLDASANLGGRISARAAGRLDPAVLTLFAPALNFSGGGVASVQMNAGGVWPNLALRGALDLRVPRLLAPSAGLDLSDLLIRATSDGSLLRIEEFSGKTKDGEISGEGSSRLPDLDFTLRARNLRLASKPTWSGRADALLKLTGTLDRPRIAGRADLAEGVYNLPQKKGEGKAAAAARAPAPPPGGPSLWERLAMAVHVAWPRRVWYRDGLTNIETSADLDLIKKSGAPELAPEGTIKTLRGVYVYYGRNFKLQSGLLTFTGPPNVNPLLDISALYQEESTEITLRITGTPEQPVLSLSSNPPLTQEDILSVLVFGVPVSELRAGKTGNSNSKEEMGQVAGEVLGSYLSRKISEKGLQKLNLDVFRVQPAQGGAKLTVGRYIGTNLFVSYGQAFGENAGRFLNAEYYLTPIWTVQAQVGTDQASHLDFQFRYPLNRPEKKTIIGVGLIPYETTFSRLP